MASRALLVNGILLGSLATAPLYWTLFCCTTTSEAFQHGSSLPTPTTRRRQEALANMWMSRENLSSRRSRYWCGPKPVTTILKSSKTTEESSSSDASSSSELHAPQAPPLDVDVDTEGGVGVGAWMPVATASGLSGLGPMSVEVAGRDYVVWQREVVEDTSHASASYASEKASTSTQWSVLEDVCPHRLAPLSQGRVSESGCIECPYHGWAFDVDGAVKSIPQLDEGKDLKSLGGKANAKSLPVHLVGDMIFAFFPSSVHGEIWPQSMLPEDFCPALSEQADLGNDWFSRELPYSVDFLIENFMDPAHIPFAHHGLQGKRQDGSPIAMETIASNFTHVEVSFKDIIQGKPRGGVVSFQRPFYYHFRTRRDDGNFKTNLNILVAPVRAGRSRIFLSRILPSNIPVPTWLLHGGSNRFLNTDTWLHDAEREARKDGKNTLKYVSASDSDKGATVFRKWWKKYGFAASPTNTFGPASIDQLPKQSRREQIDPWVGHTVNCSKCRIALRRFKRAQIGSIFVTIGSAIFLRRRPILAAIIAGSSLGLNILIRKICTFIEGNPFPSGIDDRSVAHNNNNN